MNLRFHQRFPELLHILRKANTLELKPINSLQTCSDSICYYVAGWNFLCSSHSASFSEELCSGCRRGYRHTKISWELLWWSGVWHFFVILAKGLGSSFWKSIEVLKYVLLAQRITYNFSLRLWNLFFFDALEQVRFLARSFAVPGNHPGQQSTGMRWPYGPVSF